MINQWCRVCNAELVVKMKQTIQGGAPFTGATIEHTVIVQFGSVPGSNEAVEQVFCPGCGVQYSVDMYTS